MSQFERGQKVVTTKHDPNFGFGAGEEGVVVGYDTISPEPGSSTQFEPFEVIMVKIGTTDPQSIKPEYLKAA